MAIAHSIDKPQRWDRAFSHDLPIANERRDMSDSDLDRLESIEPFASMKSDSFPKNSPLRSILKYDCRIRKYHHGDVIVRQGDYGNSAFLILGGSARVILEGLDAAVIGKQKRRQKSLWRSFSQLWTNPKSPEVRDTHLYQTPAAPSVDQSTPKAEYVFAQGVTNVLQIIPDALETTRNNKLPTGEFFGELAALGRIPRSTTVIADGDAELLEIRWQGLRDLMKHDEALRNYVDGQYRAYGLAATLQASPLLHHLSKEDAEKVAAEAVFETYGSYDWYGSYQQLRSQDLDPLSKEPIIAEQGHYPNGILLIRSGFARLSRKHGHGERTYNYLSKGEVFGLAELAYNAKHGESLPFASSLRAIGYVDVVRIPTRTFEQYILPTIPPHLIPQLPAAAEKAAAPAKDHKDSDIDPGMMEFLVEGRYINGTATMMIDMNRCTRCDDCVRACATGHDNNPVFTRQGPIHDKYMIANTCMHCVDPVCMIGCPTGAIGRDRDTGNVLINDLTCIGCQMCAASCPYDAIRMVEIRDEHADDALVIDRSQGRAITKATKCDLCIDHHGDPACQRACPHDALRRIDMRNLNDLVDWSNR